MLFVRLLVQHRGHSPHRKFWSGWARIDHEMVGNSAEPHKRRHCDSVHTTLQIPWPPADRWRDVIDRAARFGQAGDQIRIVMNRLKPRASLALLLTMVPWGASAVFMRVLAPMLAGAAAAQFGPRMLGQR